MKQSTPKATQNTRRHSSSEACKRRTTRLAKVSKHHLYDTHIWCHHAHQVRRDHSGDCSNSVCDGHKRSGIVRTHVQGTQLHARIVGAHQTHADGEEHHDENTIAAGVGGAHHEDGRTEGSQTSHHLAGVCGAQHATADHPIGHEATAHGNDPHHDVGQRGVKTVGLDRELKNVGHVLRQIRHHDVEAPIVTNLGGHQGKHGQVGEDGLPGSGGQVLVAANGSNLLDQILALAGLDEGMRRGIAVAEEDLRARIVWIITSLDYVLSAQPILTKMANQTTPRPPKK